MAGLIIYGDFNCPFSALASARADVLLGTGRYQVDWRAIQHDQAIPSTGEVVEGGTAAELEAEVASVLELSEDDLHLRLSVPPVRSNTAAASSAFAAAPTDERDRLRRRLFAAVWAEGRNVGDRAELDHIEAIGADATTAGTWQAEFEALPKPVVPTVVLPDGHVSRGLGALARLAALAEGDGEL